MIARKAASMAFSKCMGSAGVGSATRPKNASTTAGSTSMISWRTMPCHSSWACLTVSLSGESTRQKAVDRTSSNQ